MSILNYPHEIKSACLPATSHINPIKLPWIPYKSHINPTKPPWIPKNTVFQAYCSHIAGEDSHVSGGHQGTCCHLDLLPGFAQVDDVDAIHRAAEDVALEGHGRYVMGIWSGFPWRDHDLAGNSSKRFQLFSGHGWLRVSRLDMIVFFWYGSEMPTRFMRKWWQWWQMNSTNILHHWTTWIWFPTWFMFPLKLLEGNKKNQADGRKQHNIC